MDNSMGPVVCKRTLRSASESLYSFDNLVSVSVGIDTDLSQLLVSHLYQDIRCDLQKEKRVNFKIMPDLTFSILSNAS